MKIKIDSTIVKIYRCNEDVIETFKLIGKVKRGEVVPRLKGTTAFDNESPYKIIEVVPNTTYYTLTLRQVEHLKCFLDDLTEETEKEIV